MTYYRKRRPNRRTVARKSAARLSDDLLRQDIAQLRANLTGLPVGGVAPQYAGMRAAQAADAIRLEEFEAEARRRGRNVTIPE